MPIGVRMRLVGLIFAIFLAGCMHAQMVNYPGKDLPDANAPVTDPARPGTVSFAIRSYANLDDRRADAYKLMRGACNSTKYSIIKEQKKPDDPKYWLITFKCD